jgi:hypothetical protein
MPLEYWCNSTMLYGIVQAACHQLPTMVAWVQYQIRSCRICGGKSGTRAGFHPVLRFPLPVPIPATAPHSVTILPLTLHSLITNNTNYKNTQHHIPKDLLFIA